MAVRAALGATRWGVVRPLLAESLLIAIAATAVALPLASAAVRAIVLMGGAALPRVEGMQLDPRVFLFSAVVMVVAGVLVGLAPAVDHGEGQPGGRRERGRPRRSAGPRDATRCSAR